MKLIAILINKKLEFYTEANMNKQHLEALWYFYSVYNICLVIIGFQDKELKKKNNLMKELIQSKAEDNFDFEVYGKLVSHTQKDMKVIDMALEFLEAKKEAGELFGDTHRSGMFAINRYD